MNPTQQKKHQRKESPLKRHVPLLAILLILGAAVAGCGSDESREDANDVHNGNIDKSTPAVVAFNNHYPNVEIKCDGFGDLLFTVTHDDGKQPSLTVLPGHPYCTGEGKGYREIVEAGEQPNHAWTPPTDRGLYPASAAVAP